MNKYHVNILDNDLYKFTQQLAICQLYPKVKARYTFINRDHREFPEDFAIRLSEIIDSFQDYEVTSEQIDFMREKCYYMNPVYFKFLKGYRYDPTEVSIKQIDGELKVSVEGDWHSSVLWEVPLMSTISELYFEMTDHKGIDKDTRHLNNSAKAKALDEIGVQFSEFGTRRRFSFDNQAMVVDDLKKYSKGYLGTSNVLLSMFHNTSPLGTIAHEFFQAHAAMFGYLRGNEMALNAWLLVYNGDLGTALPDTFTTDIFYKYAFNTKHAKLWDGVRQDSGSPKDFIDKTVRHYKSLRIEPRLKMLLFSDNLKSVSQIKDIHDYCLAQTPSDRFMDRYGIGTWMSNDISGVKPLNIVIKLTGLDFGHGWVNTVKLSDSSTKHTGDPNEIDLCLRTLRIK
jgi:nicotinate phosphoribosyltransferase